MSQYVVLPRGANLSFSAVWSIGGVPVDLTGVTLTPFEVTPHALALSIVITVTDPTAGKFTVFCPWSSLWPAGTGTSVVVSMRVRASNGGPLSVLIPVLLA